MAGLSELPSVDKLARSLRQTFGLPHEVVVGEIRDMLAEQREKAKSGDLLTAGELQREVENRLQSLTRPALRGVINATGVVLHTNLGRAPLVEFQPLTGYSNLEYDLAQGKRGKRDAHTAHLLERLIGRKAILVNNNAAAVLLVLNEMARGHEVIVSRGELIEIGDGFRIPEIMTRAGVVLREVGTTNKTSLADYGDAINPETRLILRVHPSNFRISGFTARPSLKELTELGHAANIPVYEDLGSGCLMDLRSHGIDEPLVSDSVSAGVNLLSFSCDKLLGGPQTGIIAGEADLVARVRRNPLYRACRVDKLVIQALEATLLPLVRHDWQAIPALRMIMASMDELRQRAERVCSALGTMANVQAGESAVGGGSTPDQVLPTWLVAIDTANPNKFEQGLRRGEPPVIARVERGKIVLDMRTVADQEVAPLIAALAAAQAPN